MCAKRTIHETTMIFWLFFSAVLYASAVAQGSRQGPIVEITPNGQTAVRMGESLIIMCRVAVPIQVCRVEIPGESSLILTPGQNADDGIEYYGKGIQAGECGVQIAKVRENYDGIFKCSLTPRDSRTESQATLKIIVAKPPHMPELLLSSGSSKRNVYKKGEKLMISCSASSGRPAANVSLYLDDEPIGDDSRPTIYDTNVNDNSLAVINASRSLDWTDNGKVVRCVATHIALDRPMEAKQQLEVYYAPQPQPTIEQFGFVIGRPGIVNVTVHANPRPTFLWRVDNEKINEGRPDESNRLETSTARDMGKGTWYLTLKIDQVQKADTEKQYILEARNEEGAFEYRIVLSTSSEPAGFDLDAGSIIGIVVGVLVLLLLIFLVIFARATGRWCFAGTRSTRTMGESDLADPAASVSLLRFQKSKTHDTNGQRSDTESTGRYSRTEVDNPSSSRPRRPKITLSKFFKGKKDKVSGADTDTLRTVVTMNEEKLQTAEPASDVTPTAHPVGEGGLVYAELDLTQQQQGVAPRRINNDKTEYAEILYTKPEAEQTSPDK